MKLDSYVQMTKLALDFRFRAWDENVALFSQDSKFEKRSSCLICAYKKMKIFHGFGQGNPDLHCFVFTFVDIAPTKSVKI